MRSSYELYVASGHMSSRQNHIAGAVREWLVHELVEPFFGDDTKVGTGIVIDADGRESKQMDAVLYWPDVLPAVLTGMRRGGPSYFPVEGVAGVVEVKSTLNRHELEGAIANVHSLREHRLEPGGRPGATGHPADSDVILPLLCVFAFRSSFALETLESDLRSSESWNLVLVADQGFWLRLPDGEIRVWKESPAENLLRFATVLRDSVQLSKPLRGKPPLQHYFGLGG